MKTTKVAMALTLACLSVPTFSKALGHRKETILVKFKSTVSEDKISKKLEKLKAKIEKKIDGSNVHIVKLPPGLSEKLAAETMKGDLEVEFAEVDQLVPLDATTPTDTSFNSQWGLQKIQAPEAWDITSGSSSIIIAILDTGVEPTHPDLQANLVPGFNTASNSTNTVPITPHGTRVAGVAAAIGNNGIGVSGVCWNCKIMPMRVTDKTDGVAYWSDIAEAITWAANNGARVANASYGCWNSSTVLSSAAYMKSKGGVFVASAGNDSTNYSSPAYPKDLLVVSGSEPSDSLYSWSSRGIILTNSAPGNVYTTNTGGGYTSASGTSFAAPMTAGVVALVLSRNPSLTADQAMNAVKSGADDLGIVGYDSDHGYGRLNALRAVELAGQPQPTNGACGSANGKTFSSTPTANLCSSGSASTVTLVSNQYKWSCAGLSGGLTAYCLANYQAPDTIAPSSPSNLQASATLTTTGKGKKSTSVPTINLTWGAASDNVGVTSYLVLRNGSQIASISSLSYQDRSVVSGSTYSYSIIAVDAAGNKSVASNGVSVVAR